jgi:hypothetical protein
VLRCLLLIGLALCGLAHAIEPPRIDLTAAPAWKGWSRPGRATEIDIRVTADTPTKTTLEVAAGRQVVRAELDLQPGRTVRLQIPVASTERIALTVGAPAASAVRRDVGIAQSESPVLGVGLVTDEAVALEGFHTVLLGADDLPRNARAYSSVDALILDAADAGCPRSTTARRAVRARGRVWPHRGAERERARASIAGRGGGVRRQRADERRDAGGCHGQAQGVAGHEHAAGGVIRRTG